MCLCVDAFGDGIIKEIEKVPNVTLSIVKPIRPVHSIVRPVVIYQDNYNHTEYNNCTQYMETITQKDEEILALKSELNALKSKENRKMSKALKKSYDAELEKFDDRKSGIKTKNSIIVEKKTSE